MNTIWKIDPTNYGIIQNVIIQKIVPQNILGRVLSGKMSIIKDN